MKNTLISELHDVFPPVEIALPSRGLFYPNGVLAEGTDPQHITVGTLGIMDEFKYRDPFFLVTGRAIEHLIQHVCPGQITHPEELCEIDVEAILLAARIASYGPNLKLTHTCTLMREKPLDDGEKRKDPPEMVTCGHSNPMMLDLHEFILRYGPIEDESRFEVVLPRVQQTVYLRPTPYRTTMNIMRNVMGNTRRIENLEGHQDEFVSNPELFNEYETLMQTSADLQVSTLLDCIWGVKTRSGIMVEDPEQIMAWIFELPKSDHDVISARITEVTEEFRKISMVHYNCEECKQQNSFNLQMNSEILFLAASEDSKAPKISSDMPAKNRSSFRTPSRISRK